MRKTTLDLRPPPYGDLAPLLGLGTLEASPASVVFWLVQQFSTYCRWNLRPGPLFHLAPSYFGPFVVQCLLHCTLLALLPVHGRMMIVHPDGLKELAVRVEGMRSTAKSTTLDLRP